VTPELFRRWPTPEALAGADEAEVAQVIFATGFHNQKARSIIGAARAVLASHRGRVPRTVEALVKLPGVGRKTAAVVSGNAFGRNQGIAVDTHAGRLARRLGFTVETDPDRVERELLELVPRSRRTLFTHLMIYHGRAVCTARSPRHLDCVLLDLCPTGLSETGLSRSAARARTARGRSAASSALPPPPPRP
jgi:endonuclease-3